MLLKDLLITAKDLHNSQCQIIDALGFLKWRKDKEPPTMWRIQGMASSNIICKGEDTTCFHSSTFCLSLFSFQLPLIGQNHINMAQDTMVLINVYTWGWNTPTLSFRFFFKFLVGKLLCHIWFEGLCFFKTFSWWENECLIMYMDSKLRQKSIQNVQEILENGKR